MYESKDHVPYAHHEYPKWVYKGEDGIIVNDEAEHDAAKEKGYGGPVDLEASDSADKPVKPKKKSKKVESE